jgi:hypothetical protein
MTNYLSFKLIVFLELLPKSGCLEHFSHNSRFVLPVDKIHCQLEYRAQRQNPKSLKGGKSRILHRVAMVNVLESTLESQRGGGAQSPAGEGLGESQFQRLDKKLSTLSTLLCTGYSDIGIA